MSLTAEQLEARKHAIYSTDAAAIACSTYGWPSFRSLGTILVEKVTGQSSFEGSDATDWGNDLEPILKRRAIRKYGLCRENVTILFDEGPIAGTTLDLQSELNGTPIELKSTGVVGPVHGHWGEEGTDEVPELYMCQCQIQLKATKKDVMPLRALIASRGEVEFIIHRNDTLIRMIIEACEPVAEAIRDRNLDSALMEKYPPTMTALKSIPRVPSKVVSVGDDVRAAWLMKKQLTKDSTALSNAAEAYERQIVTALGDAEGCVFPDGSGLTYFTQKRDGHTVEPYEFRQLKERKSL